MQLEIRIGTEMQVEWNIVSWMTEHAAYLLNRYRAGQDGCSSYKRLMGKNSSRAVFEIGEQVLCKPMRAIPGKEKEKKSSWHSKWLKGTYVGTCIRSLEHLIVLPEGGAPLR